MIYFPGTSINSPRQSASPQNTERSPTQSEGLTPVDYQLNNASGNPDGTVRKGIQISTGEIQPEGYPANPIITIGTQAGQASQVSPASPSDIWVDESGDSMTGALDMTGNEIKNAIINQGTF